jgi:hypothetical protein
VGDAQLSAVLLASHLSRTAFEVANILEPGRDLIKLRQVLAEAGAEAPLRIEGPQAGTDVVAEAPVADAA